MTHSVDMSKLEKIELQRGAHIDPQDGLCLMEAVAYVRGLAHDDRPPCVSVELGVYGRGLNDRLPHDLRQQLKELIPLLPGTGHDRLDSVRHYAHMDRRARVLTPKWLERAGLTKHAARLRALPPIVDSTSMQGSHEESRRALRAARQLREDLISALCEAANRAVGSVQETGEAAPADPASAAVAAAVGAVRVSTAAVLAIGACSAAVSITHIGDIAGDVAYRIAKRAVEHGIGGVSSYLLHDKVYIGIRGLLDGALAELVAECHRDDIDTFRRMIRPEGVSATEPTTSRLGKAPQ